METRLVRLEDKVDRIDTKMGDVGEQMTLLNTNIQTLSALEPHMTEMAGD